ncbi:hypothetical protein ACHBTE_00420 [Streptomyces sp. M41]|uniref:hypothetical protein n=1 Tax=Streptomyces sp. M41 TaxID=3059412 RepID=UPI00374D5D28
MPTGGGVDILRLTRAAVFAVVCLTATGLGHSLVSGDVPPWWSMGLAFGGTFAGAWWLTWEGRGAPAVVGATVLAQGLLHLFFGLAHAVTRSPAAPMTHMGAHDMAHSHAHAVGGSASPTAHMTMAEPGSSGLAVLNHGASAGMLLGHLLAAVVCGLWLWQGESAVHRIGLALAGWLFAPLVRALRVLFGTTVRYATAPRQAVAARARQGRAAPAWLRHVVVRRGPPRPLDPSSTGPPFPFSWTPRIA